MKKHLILFLVSISMTFFVGCDYDDEIDPPNYVTFESNSLDLAVHENSSESMDVSVYTGNITGSDRTFSINVDPASTIDPSAYSLPERVTIPANTNEASISIDVTGAGIANEGDVLILKLGEGEGAFTGKGLTLNLNKVCDFERTGSFNNNSGWFGSEFPVEIVAGSAANQYVVKDLFSEGTDITFTVNDDLSISVPTQNSFVHPRHGQASVTGRPGSKIEPCIGKITLALRHTVAAGSFGTFNEVLTRRVDAGEGDGSEGEGDGDDSGDGGGDS